MAVVNLKSTPITNLDASPRVANQAGLGAKAEYGTQDALVSVAATDQATSTYRFTRIRSNALVKKVTIEGAALGGSCAMNYGLAYPPAGPDLGIGGTAGGVIDADFFASAVVHTNAMAETIITNEGGFYTMAERFLPIWQAAGLSADPGGWFDVMGTMTVDAASGGDLYMKVETCSP